MFVADLHVHSKFARATSRDLDLVHLAHWAALKGVAVVGTGDCVHPGWLSEIEAQLDPVEDGLFALKPECAAAADEALPPSCRTPVRFLLTTEISTIYKKDGRTRKVHHVVLLPSFAAAHAFSDRLARIGNIHSDGRPILGLDSRDLLETVLETDPAAYLIPAHIWTPWFSALGHLSGFDSIDACYGDLADHIFAVETGLSSDPAMNRRVSSLDRYRLVSNSDAHSPAKLGREATCFSCAAGFSTIRAALQNGDGYRGTVEFFPEEGKYHLDGHRACSVRLDPKETIAAGGLCPVCGKPVTVGVAHRVEMLADRDAPAAPPTAGAVSSFVPLIEILSEILQSGPGSHAVTAAFGRALSLGPELTVLGETPLEDIVRIDPDLSEAIGRLRAGKVVREGGYDGEYGVIRLFAEGELDRRVHGGLLFDAPSMPRRRTRAKAAKQPEADAPVLPFAAPAPAKKRQSHSRGRLAELDADQIKAVMSPGPLAVIAGPGSGKTRVLIHRLAYWIEEKHAAAESCLAVTFTRRATEELKTRLSGLLGRCRCAVHSFHSLGLTILRAEGRRLDLPDGFRVAGEGERAAALVSALHVTAAQAAKTVKRLSFLKRTGGRGEAEEELARQTLEILGREQGWIDFDDLVILAVRLLETDPDAAARWRFDHVLADEFQDIDPWQYRLLRLVTAEGGDLCVIGDPDQAIYGFRGADEACFARFLHDYPGCPVCRLERNYRSGGAIVTAASALMGHTRARPERPQGEPVTLFVAADEKAEAAYVAAAIADMMGGHDMLTAGFGGDGSLGFADFAVLYRTDTQAAVLRAAFDAAGIPYQKSRPARLIDHAGVAAILTALTDAGDGLTARIMAACETVRMQGKIDTAMLSEARGWLMSLADGTEDEAAWRMRAALASEADFLDPRAARVPLLTMHAAKGLEFAVVFVIGVEEEIVPFSFAREEGMATVEEEQRLFYVAMTRAKNRLILTRAQTRFWRGGRRALAPSPFLAKIETARAEIKRLQGRDRKPVQYKLF